MLEVYLAPAGSGENLLSDELLRDTKAQVMTSEEVEQLGFQSVSENPRGGERRFIRVAKQHQRAIHTILEMNPDVASIRLYDLDS